MPFAVLPALSFSIPSNIQSIVKLLVVALPPNTIAINLLRKIRKLLDPFDRVKWYCFDWCSHYYQLYFEEAPINTTTTITAKNAAGRLTIFTPITFSTTPNTPYKANVIMIFTNMYAYTAAKSFCCSCCNLFIKNLPNGVSSLMVNLNTVSPDRHLPAPVATSCMHCGFCR